MSKVLKIQTERTKMRLKDQFARTTDPNLDKHFNRSQEINRPITRLFN